MMDLVELVSFHKLAVAPLKQSKQSEESKSISLACAFLAALPGLSLCFTALPLGQLLRLLPRFRFEPFGWCVCFSLLIFCERERAARAPTTDRPLVVVGRLPRVCELEKNRKKLVGWRALSRETVECARKSRDFSEPP